MAPAARPRRWSITQRWTLAASYGSYSAASISGVLPKYSKNTSRSTARASSAAGSADGMT